MSQKSKIVHIGKNSMGSVVIIGPIKSSEVLELFVHLSPQIVHYICPDEDQIQQLRRCTTAKCLENARLYDCQADELPFDGTDLQFVIHRQTINPSLMNELQTINQQQHGDSKYSLIQEV